ncbi:MAG: hypothetical protein ABGZ53_09500 [Fuerstiella sp.]
MQSTFAAALLLFAMLSNLTCDAADRVVFGNVECEGDYQHHLQGVCTNEVDAIYWSFTTELVKTDRSGRVLTKIAVANHHGDLCFTRGKIYVAVNHGRFNDPDGKADSWVYVYSQESLEFLSKRPTSEVFHGAGGIGVMNDHFYVVGGLPDGIAQNYVYEYDADFNFLRKHVVNSGWTQLGIQTAAFHDGVWWFGCYGSPKIVLKTDSQFRMLGRFEFDCSLGIVGVARDRLLVAKGPRTKDQRCLGSLHLMHPDAEHGLRLVPDTVLAINKERVKRSGAWRESRFRFAKDAALQTTEHQSSVEFVFEGSGVSLRLGGHNVPAYGSPNLGTLAVTIDGAEEQSLTPRSLPREIVLADGLPAGPHTVRIVHRNIVDLSGCRIESLRTWSDARGELQFHVSADENAHLVDCRAILRHGETIVRNTLVRNWLTGQCSLTGIPPGDDYSLEVRATGWQTAHVKNISVDADDSTRLTPIYLSRDAATVTSRFRFPRLNQPAIREPGQTFRARFLGFNTSIDKVTLTRTVGSAVISRVVSFEEDKSAAYYYDREVVISLPGNMPAGAYDLSVQVTGGGRTGLCRSPRSVHVVSEFPQDPLFITFGHLDTSGQYQAEYLQRLVTAINVLAPDMVLCSNACNPAYVSGALAGLDMPYIINFGNHQFSGHESWYGDPVGMTDYGPHVSVLNFGFPWHTDMSRAEALLASRPDTAVRVINAFEANAPVSLLDRHRVRMIHDAHGTGNKVMDIGATPTRRIGKTNSASFRVVRFRDNQVESCTYNGHETSPIPFPREAVSPLSVSFDHPNDGTEPSNAATVSNQLLEPFPNGRVRFVVPAGTYAIAGGRLESIIVSDDGRFHVLTVHVDIPANSSATVMVKPN